MLDNHNTRGLAESAQGYARNGWRVFPLHAVHDGDCSCGKDHCSSAGKHPRTKNGVKDATTDARQIARWWEQWPLANIGIATGTATGLYVIDVDCAKGATLESLEELGIVGLTWTLTVRTGSGGYHLYLLCPQALGNTAGKLAPYVDTRGDGGRELARGVPQRLRTEQVEMIASAARAHGKCPRQAHNAQFLQALQRCALGAIHVDDVKAGGGAGGDANVRQRPLFPPACNLSSVGRGILHAIFRAWMLARRRAMVFPARAIPVMDCMQRENAPSVPRVALRGFRQSASIVIVEHPSLLSRRSSDIRVRRVQRGPVFLIWPISVTLAPGAWSPHTKCSCHTRTHSSSDRLVLRA